MIRLNKFIKEVQPRVLVGLMVIANMISLSVKANGESSQEEPMIYPTLGIYLESESAEGFERWPFRREANNGCKAEVVDIKDMTPHSSQDFPKNSCVVNDKVLYSISRLSISSCHWEGKGEMNARFPLLEGLTKKFEIENFRVQFRDNTMWCEADLIVEDQKKVPVEGTCAVASPSPFESVNGRAAVDGENTLVFNMDPVHDKNTIMDAAKKVKNLGIRPQVLMMGMIPLNKTGSSYLSYMLSQRGIDDCAKQATTSGERVYPR